MSPEMIQHERELASAGSSNGTTNGATNRHVAADDAAQVTIDTSNMSESQRQSMEVAESAREAHYRDSFAGRMLLGTFDPKELLPFPTQDADDRNIGDVLVAKVSKLLQDTLDAELADETRTIPHAVVKGLADLGVFRMKVPAEYGGLGLSQVNYNRVIMAIASHCGSTAVLVSAHQSIGVPQPLKMFGTDEQKQRFLPRIAEGALSAFALTEPDVGSDPARMSTTAKLSDDGTHYILNGIKQWTTNGPIADLLVVMAQTEPKVRRGKVIPQITAFIVEANSPGVKTVHRCDFMGLRAIQNGILQFTDVRVPAENLLWGEGLGLKLALKTLNTGRLTLPAACTGMGKQCLSIARRWSRKREQWGSPIGKHEAGAAKISFIASTTFAMESLAWLTSHWAQQGRDIRIEAAMAKLFCSEASWRIIDETMQLRAGRGYERAISLRERGETPYPLERMMRDCRINTIIEGTSDIMRLFLAREALDPHLRRSMVMLNPASPMSAKLRAGVPLLGHYSKWYVERRIGALGLARHRSAGKLAQHFRYLDRCSNRLATALFHAMTRYQQKLEKRQVLLGRLMDIATELFAMSATCAHALSLAEDAKRSNCVELADLFCIQARQRVQQHFRLLGDVARTPSNRIARDILDDRYLWLEEGIVPCCPEAD